MVQNAKFLTLVGDGKADVAKQSVTNWILCNTSGASIMYEFNSGTPAKTGRPIANDLIEMGLKIKEETSATLSFVSDSAASYVKARHRMHAAHSYLRVHVWLISPI